MITIAKENQVITLINTFTVVPERQQQLVDMIVETTQSVMQHLSGFVATSVHTSLDGTKVVNYAQWRSRADFEAMRANPEAQAKMQTIAEIAEADANLYKVAKVIVKSS